LRRRRGNLPPSRVDLFPLVVTSSLHFQVVDMGVVVAFAAAVVAVFAAAVFAALRRCH
jgi:hypothetical protein